MKKTNFSKCCFCRLFLLLAIAGIVLPCSRVLAQTKPKANVIQSPAIAAPNAKRMAFEVISIRPSKRGLFGGVSPQRETLETQADGYRAVDQPLISTIIFAYLPHSYSWTSESAPLNQPNWLHDEYDIQAKVAAADMAEWQTQGPRKEMLSAMLRSLLEDRCKLAVHWVTGQSAGYALVVGKHGQKLKNAAHGEPLPPAGYPVGAKGFQVRLGNTRVPGTTYFPIYRSEKRTDVPMYNISMEVLAAFLSDLTEVPIVNQTGLSGNYDLVLKKREKLDQSGMQDTSVPDPGPRIEWDVEPLGLKLVPVKTATRRLAIDHIERSSEN